MLLLFACCAFFIYKLFYTSSDQTEKNDVTTCVAVVFEITFH